MLQQSPLDRIFQALADPSRREIVRQLSLSDASVSELAKPFTMSLAAVVQHVQVLEACGLVCSKKVGRVRHCYLQHDILEMAETWLSQRRTTWEGHLDRLGEVLAQKKAERARSATAPTTHPATPRRTRKST
jgi:DNA-binding transcriptional ArsR family regulator